MSDYISPDKVTRVRVWTEGDEWFIDGADEHGGYTESCWTYDSEAAALANVADFRRTWEIADNVPMVVVP